MKKHEDISAAAPAGPVPTLTPGIRAFTTWAWAQVQLPSADILVPSDPTQSSESREFLAALFVATWQWEIDPDPVFASVLKGTSAMDGGLVDTKVRAVRPAAALPGQMGPL